MPQDVGVDYTLKSGRKVQGYLAAGSPQTLAAIDSADVPYSARRPRYTKIEYGRMPEPIIAKKRGAGAATGTAADVNVISWPGHSEEYFIIGTQTIVAPLMAAGGLDIGSMDQASGDGLSLDEGVLGNGDRVYTVGTSQPFFAEFKVKATTVANIGSLFVGFRKLEARQALYTSYAQCAGFLLSGGDVVIATRQSGATVTTDTTTNMADATYVTVRVMVGASGQLSYTVNGSNPVVAPTVALSLTNGSVVIPFVEFIQGSSQTACVLSEKSVGYQA